MRKPKFKEKWPVQKYTTTDRDSALWSQKPLAWLVRKEKGERGGWEREKEDENKRRKFLKLTCLISNSNTFDLKNCMAPHLNVGHVKWEQCLYPNHSQLYSYHIFHNLRVFTCILQNMAIPGILNPLATLATKLYTTSGLKSCFRAKILMEFSSWLNGKESD